MISPSEFLLLPAEKTTWSGEVLPTGLDENMKLRQSLLAQAKDNKALQQELIKRCKVDLLFFTNLFCWIYEPRLPERLPWVTYPFQDLSLHQMTEALTHKDVVVAKSRDMGVTWMCLLLFFHRWLFFPYQTFLLISRTEDEVDKTDDSDTLMWKLDFLYNHLPSWMQPDITRHNLHLKNEQNESLLDGRSTTGNVGRGGRRTAILNDELAAFRPGDDYKVMAATQAVTNTRLFVSTPQGASGAFYDQCHDENSDSVQIRLHWSQHPEKNPGLYSSEGGKLDILDKEYHFPPGYRFTLDQKYRSPWYDRECKRGLPKHLIAQELDIDFGGSGRTFFDPGELKQLEGGCRNPVLTGAVSFDEGFQEVSFIESKGGPLRLWCNLDPIGLPSREEDYAIGADIATGLAGKSASNSVLSVVSLVTGEKVAEFASHDTPPTELARQAVALCKFFRGRTTFGAFLIWEDNGPGASFRKAVMEEYEYTNVYYRRSEEHALKVKSKSPGWYSTAKTKLILLTEYGIGLRTGKFLNRSFEAVRECGFYVYVDSNKIEHVKVRGTMDPTGAGENHGDRVIADALACRALKDRPTLKLEETKAASMSNPPPGSYAQRRRERDLEKRRQMV